MSRQQTDKARRAILNCMGKYFMADTVQVFDKTQLHDEHMFNVHVRYYDTIVSVALHDFEDLDLGIVFEIATEDILHPEQGWDIRYSEPDFSDESVCDMEDKIQIIHKELSSKLQH